MNCQQEASRTFLTGAVEYIKGPVFKKVDFQLREYWLFGIVDWVGCKLVLRCNSVCYFASTKSAYFCPKEHREELDLLGSCPITTMPFPACTHILGYVTQTLVMSKLTALNTIYSLNWKPNMRIHRSFVSSCLNWNHLRSLSIPSSKSSHETFIFRSSQDANHQNSDPSRPEYQSHMTWVHISGWVVEFIAKQQD